jgi:AsmA protein
MRKLGIAIAVLLVVVVAVLAIAPKMLNVNHYHDQIQSQLSAKLGRPVTLGAMSLSLLPPKFTVENAAIFEDKKFGSGTFAQMQSMAVRVKLLPLLHKDVEIQSLTLEHPQVELVRDEQGVWNFSSLGKTSEPAAAPSQPATKTPAKPTPAQTSQPSQGTQGGQNFELSQLDINDGSVAITDRQKHQARALYDHIDVTLKDYA